MKHCSALCIRLSDVPQRAETAFQSAVSAAAQEALFLAKSRVPTRTGRLRGSLHAEETRLSASVSTAVPYAAYVERRRAYLLPSALDSRFLERARHAGREVL